MLEETKDKTSSVLVSALGAWLALGAGLVFMVFSLLAVSWLVKGEDSLSKTSSRLLTQSVGRDLTSMSVGGATLSEDGLTLTLNTAGENGSKSEVVYSVQEGLLTRSEDGADLKLVAKFDALRFSIQQKRLVAEWNSGDRKEIENWALDRWGTP